MRKMFAMVAIAMFFASVAFGQAYVTITNNSSYDLWGLYTSGTDGDLLPTSTLNSGYYTTITYPVGYQCVVSLWITYYDYDYGQEYTVATFSNVDICNTKSITLYDEYYVKDGYSYYYD